MDNDEDQNVGVWGIEVPQESEESYEAPMEAEESYEEAYEEPSRSGGVDPTLALNLVQQALNQGQRAPQQEQQKALSEAELDELLGVYRLDEDFVDSVFGDSTDNKRRLQALQELVNRTAQHAIKTSGQAMRLMRQELEQKLNPVYENVQTETTKNFSAVITQHYPGFEGKESLLNRVIKQMQQEGYRPSGPDHLHNEIAAEEVVRRASELAQTVIPNFNPQIGVRKPAKPKMAMLAGGSSSGGSQGGERGSRNENMPAWKQALS